MTIFNTPLPDITMFAPEWAHRLYTCEECFEDICEGDDYYEIIHDGDRLRFCVSCMKEMRKTAEAEED